MGRVLLLNATYEPLQLLSSRRAVLLLVDGRAEAVSTPSDPEVCRSASLTVEIPSVMRLQYVVKLPSRVRVPPLTRRSVLQRDNHSCAYCSAEADTVDHVRPRSRGGKNEWSNVVAACRLCNFKKGDRLLEELGWRLRFDPRAPDGYGWRWRNLGDSDPAWTEYLPKAS
jgi:5-methylcytosine-specific restriction endonuclease McrA